MCLGPDPDDLLQEGYTTATGEFVLAGDTTEGTRIDPHLKIYHDCNDGIIVRFIFYEGERFSRANAVGSSNCSTSTSNRAEPMSARASR